MQHDYSENPDLPTFSDTITDSSITHRENDIHSRSIKLVSCDQQILIVQKNIWKNYSSLIEQMTEDISEETMETIPLPDKSANQMILLGVNNFLEQYCSLKNNDEKSNLLDTFCKNLSDDQVLNYMIVANYLDIKILLDSTCKYIAEEIKKCRTPEDIKARFKITKDFVPHSDTSSCESMDDDNALDEGMTVDDRTSDDFNDSIPEVD